MKIRHSNRSQFKDSQITDESVYHNRRSFIKQLAVAGGVTLASQPAQASFLDWFTDGKNETSNNTKSRQLAELNYQKDSSELKRTPYDKVTQFNNFYEFGTSKTEPAEHASALQVNPWDLKISGLVDKPYQLGYEDLFSQFDLYERVYRLRCVEAWSMVVPWIGIPLAKVLERAQVQNRAKYVSFKTLYRPSEMRGQSSRFIGGNIDYPYREGLTIAEAMHPLTILAVGLYGKELPNQNGAPVRLIVPWKYGFKSIKSIVSIELTNHQPITTWNQLAPDEYGFYANVNPNVDHPRWSQASERVITTGGLFEQTRVPTQMFNGYGEQVANLYKNINLKTNY
ncbi:protein-methionine-sulfoxide reductase catalytic subunit MsrP [Gayadomonas joobiniege]|uniref:protein-methionine-sulfoxide reductase catalytic subunit MsrP n=1 Tax=Gayadomonas joobiniege TaxID=1234606 RepID=UPI0003738F94|nr:protein-methionine-sulfoxide reductase catalytic subunit MsrP [Gayadomonas joobiniege]